MSNQLAVIILAAGKGTRMESPLPKVLHSMAGMPMLGHVLNAAHSMNPSRTIVITGYGAEDVETYIADHFPHAECVRQTEQLGTGHAVLQAEAALKGFTGTVLLLCGDVPLVTHHTLNQLRDDHEKANSLFTIVTASMPDPTGLGRILRNEDKQFQGVVEQKDATEAQRAITEINTGLYAAACPEIFSLLHGVTNENVQKEYYLPDAAKVAMAQNLKVVAEPSPQPATELMGVNTPAQLALAEQTYLNRLP